MGNDSNEAEVGMNSGYAEKIKSLHTGAALVGVAKTTNELYNAIIETMIEVLGYPLSGLAIPDGDFMHFFQLFERLHTKSEYEGTGAGLTICKKKVENFGGRLWIESEEGEGSTFYFTYPRDEVENNE